MQTDGNNRNKLRQNSSTKDIYAYLNNARVQRDVVIAWLLVGDIKITAEVLILGLKRFRDEIQFGALPHMKDQLEKIISNSEKINFFIQDSSVLFQGKIREFSPERGLCIHFPNMIAQLERRKHFRLLLGESLKANALFAKNSDTSFDQASFFEKKLHDISSGGMSFIISRMEEKFFKKGDVLRDIELLLEEESFFVDSEIVACVPVEPNEHNRLAYRGIKICTQYTSVTQETQKSIEQFVFQYLHFPDAI